jgi:hypothetical protein
MHCPKNVKQIFPETKLRGLVPNFYSHVSASDLYIPTISLQTQYSKIGGPAVGIYKSLAQIHDCRNLDCVSFIFGNICYQFSVQCMSCIPLVVTSFFVPSTLDPYPCFNHWDFAALFLATFSVLQSSPLVLSYCRPSSLVIY